MGLIDIVDGAFNNRNYEELKNHPYVEARKMKFKVSGEEIEVKSNELGINITNYGGNSVEICLGREDYHAD